MSNKKVLNDESLDKVSGGDIKEGGERVLVRNYIMLAKDQGWDLGKTIEYFTDCWIRNSDFKQHYTDGKSSDFDAAISFIKNNFDKY